MGRRAKRLSAVLVAFVLLAAACSSSGSESSSGSQPATGDTAVAVSGGSATLIQPQDVALLDPTTIINCGCTGSAVMNALYDVLFTVDADGTFNPRLATDFSTTDGITWTLTLRSGVTFTDGTPFDAEAVRTQWENLKTDPTQGTYSYFVSIDSMSVVDAATLTVVLKSPNYQFLRVIDWSNAGWIPSPTAMAAAGDDFTENPVGAGPFVLESRTPNFETVLTRNPNYWQEGLPKLDTLTIRTVPDSQQMYDTVATGAGQAAINVPDQFVPQAEAAGMTVVGVDQIAGAGWLFNANRAPFDDIRARKAVYLALDMNALSDTLAEGQSDVPMTLFPESSPFYNPDITLPQADATEAQRLFDELADEGKPVKFVLMVPPGESGTRAVALQTQLAAFDNVEVSINNADGATYGPSLFSGAFDLAAYGFGGLDPEPSLASMQTDWAIPIASMHSEVIDQAVADGQAASTHEARQAAYDTLATELADLYQMLFMFRNHVWTIETPEVTGLVLYGQGSPLLEEWGRVE